MAEAMVEITRGPLVESIHRGDMAVVNPSGELLYYLGDPNKVTYMRSSAKPIQALAVIESGAADCFGFSDRELAVMCASHSAEKIHVDTVLSILDKIGLDETALGCGSHLPIHEESRNTLIRGGSDPTQVHSNCSGKHSGMLAVCVQNGWPLDDYYQPDHPLQRLLLENMEGMSDVPVRDIAIGVDGCGVAVWGVPIRAMALSFARLVDPSGLPPIRQRAVRRIVAAIKKHPEMIAGTDRFCTALVRATRPDVVAKSGAEGVYCLGHNAGRVGLALKVEDGNGRATAPAAVEALNQLGLLKPAEAEKLQAYHYPENTNVRGEVVGEVRPAFELKKA